VEWLAASAGAVLALYAAGVVALWRLGRREEARALARFVPDLARLVAALARDRRLGRARRLALLALAAYLASPIDLVPDFVPVAGQLDDALLVALALRSLVRAAGPELVREHWRGPEAGLRAVLRLAGVD
jgi:uncharacterized membrane protein YkvA (DUF1232 family)